MTFMLILLAVIFIGATINSIIKHSEEKERKAKTPPPKPLSAMNMDELNEKLDQAETDIEMRKIEYQAALSNPYVTHINRDLSR